MVAELRKVYIEKKPRVDCPAANKTTTSMLVAALKATHIDLTGDQRQSDDGADGDAEIIESPLPQQVKDGQARMPASIRVPRLATAERKELDMLEEIISPN